MTITLEEKTIFEETIIGSTYEKVIPWNTFEAPKGDHTYTIAITDKGNYTATEKITLTIK